MFLSICVHLSVFLRMHGKGGETVVLVVSVMLLNYLFVPCSHADQDGIDNNCLRLL